MLLLVLLSVQLLLLLLKQESLVLVLLKLSLMNIVHNVPLNHNNN